MAEKKELNKSKLSQVAVIFKGINRVHRPQVLGK